MTSDQHSQHGFAFTDPAEGPDPAAAPQAWQPQFATPVAQPVTPQPIPQAAQPAAQPVTQPAPPAPDVAPVTAADVQAMLGFNPDTLGTTAPPTPTAADPHPAQAAYLAPAPTRVAQHVPVTDPRGGLHPVHDAAPRTGFHDDHPAPPTAPATNPVGRPQIERLLVGLVENGGSDCHLAHNHVPRYRIAGSLLEVAGQAALRSDQIEALLSEALPPEQWAEYTEHGDLDCRYSMYVEDGAALTVGFRVNVARTMGRTSATFRVIPTEIVDLDTLGVLPQVKDLAQRPHGLLLFCGPVNSGKSTSMAGFVDEINRTREARIQTLEEPIEFVHQSKKSMITHREVGVDTPSFAEGLRRIRRQDPNVILIGEMRDFETIEATIQAAENGALVIATLHSNTAPDTISRIINVFPAEQQEQIRTTLAETLLAVVCQKLVPTKTSARGRVVAQEIMMATAAVKANIRENDIPAIRNALTDRSSGSISRDAHLVDLIRAGKITRKEAYKAAASVSTLDAQLGEG